MRSVFFIFILGIVFGNLTIRASALPQQTHIPLSIQKGCIEHINVWLSPSCTHCAKYFLDSDKLPKVASLPGLCMNLYFLPHLYPLDIYIAVLIWSQGPGNAYTNAKFFFEHQDEWLSLSASRADLNDSDRGYDLSEFLAKVAQKSPGDYEKIRNYLQPNDLCLYVKMIALKYGKFSVEHLEKFLPRSGGIDASLSQSVMREIPADNGMLINFSPAFTYKSGYLVPNQELERGILTESAAAQILAKKRKFIESQKTAPIISQDARHDARKADLNLSTAQDIQDADEAECDTDNKKQEPAKNPVNKALTRVTDAVPMDIDVEPDADDGDDLEDILKEIEAEDDFDPEDIVEKKQKKPIPRTTNTKRKAATNPPRKKVNRRPIN